ncbi:MAG: DUF1353 domain-containing protein [Verrucomicrobiaceae bacterium]|nr:MAG: DUF1353 domain-containing protein [Verrucomicrobiaceae bacterium]
MKIQFRHVLIPCAALAGCMPMGPSGSDSRPYPSHQVSHQRAAQPRPDAPELKKLKNGHYYVRKPWTVTINGRDWHIPKGYSSNGITAPARFKATLGDGIDHKETWAAVFHDWLFTQPGVSRAQADRMFYDLLIAYGVPNTKANLMYRTVSAYSLTKSDR